MALQASGTIKLSEIQTEFGGSNPISLSEYYGADTGVPASGTIQLAADFYGTSAVTETVTLSGTSGSPNIDTTTRVDPNTSTTGWKFKTDGTVYKTGVLANDANYTVQFNSGTEWNDGQTSPTGSYWIRFTNFSGSNGTGSTYSSWLALTSDRTIQWQQVGVGTTQGVTKVEIATDSGGSTIVGTGYYSGVSTVN